MTSSQDLSQDYKTNKRAGLRYLSSSAHAKDIVTDFEELFQNRNSAYSGITELRPPNTNSYYLSYHGAITALHHAHANASIRAAIHNLGKSGSGLVVLDYYHEAKYIERPLSSHALTLARTKAMLHATELSELKTYQRTRAVGGAMAAILALKLVSGPVRGNVTGVNCKAFHHILRKASGSYQRMSQIAAPYTDRIVNKFTYISDAECTTIKNEMKRRFDDHAPTKVLYGDESLSGPIEFHVSEFYANRCIRLIECYGAEKKWAELENKLQRVRRGEIKMYQVLLDPSDDYWVYSIFYTFYFALKKQLDANQKWRQNYDEVDTTSNAFNQANPTWTTAYSSGSGISISKSCTRNEQTIKMVHILYTFIIRTQRILSDRFMGVFGLCEKLRNVTIMRMHHLSTEFGDETSALVMGHFIPCIMSPSVHIDIAVDTHIYQNSMFYVKMSDLMFGKLKKKFRKFIPSRHNGYIDRRRLMYDIY